MKSRSSRAVLTAAFSIAALLASIIAAVAAGTGTVTPPPRIAIVANAFNGADALAVGPTAGQFGAPIFTTNQEGLSEAAKAGIVAYAPELVIVVGGTGALSDTVLSDLAAALGLAVQPENTHPSGGIVRIKGTGRMETAVAISELLGAYNPAFLPDAATAADADLLDGMDSTDFVGAPARTTYVGGSGTDVENGAALLAAVAALPAIGGGDLPWRLILEPGTYDIGTSQLLLDNNTWIIGAGVDATRIEGSHSSAALDAAAAVVVATSGTHLSDVYIRNEAYDAGAARKVAAVFTDSSIVIADAYLGQNVNTGGSTNPSSYGVISDGGFVTADRTTFLGFANSSNSGVGTGLYLKDAGARIHDALFSTQGTASGGGVHLDGTASRTVDIYQSRVRGFGAGVGFLLSNASGEVHWLFSVLEQSGIDGVISAGAATLGSVQRDSTITVLGGTAACAYNFTSSMGTPSC